MMKGRHLNTRISQRAYKEVLLKCADGGCSPYEYIRQLIHADVGLDVEGDVPQELEEGSEAPIQTELIEKNERDDEGRIKIIG